jgi:hypothetical protein
MNRRRFLSNIAGGAGSLAIAGLQTAGAVENAPQPDSTVKQVLVMFKCHFDAGFIDTQAAVVRKYFEQYYPRAIRIAQAQRDAGRDGYVWTTGSWLLYEYLEQANSEQRKRMEQAIAAGDIAWHALPFSWQSELLNPSAIQGAIGFSKSLDKRFGQTTTGAKMTDVPGHSRGIIGPLSENGVTFLDIGVNAASTPPDVPSAFVWKNASGASLTMMYHHEYGGVMKLPLSDLAIAIEVRDDNSGPHTAEEIRKICAGLRRRFPKATVRAANLTQIANAVNRFKSALPVITQEIGDTWIYGVASDPVKLARYRELLRLREEWIGRGTLTAGDEADLAFLRRFALAAEHTWGTDTKTWLDFDHYTPDALASMLDTPHYKVVTGSWIEKRNDIAQGMTSLPSKLQSEANRRLASLKPTEPDVSSQRRWDPGKAIDAGHFIIALDPQTGAIHKFQNKRSKHDWASSESPLALFSYQTLSKQDYDRFLASYITVKTDWAPKDFGKPNIEKFGAASRKWNTRLVKCWAGEDDHSHRIVAQLEIGANEKERKTTAWPERIYLDIALPKAEPRADITLKWFGKRSNRMPEALWLTFQPNAPRTKNWILDKIDQPVSPYDVVAGGNRHMHAVSGGIHYQDSIGKFTIETKDAPLVVLGEQSPIYFSNEQPDLSRGIHFSLYNNGWGTNYIQWFGEDMQFRFTLRA